MFKPADIIIDDFVARLRDEFARAHPAASQQQRETLDRAARLAMTHVARSNALFTNMESMLLMCEVALSLLEGRQIERYDVTPRDWMNFVLAALSAYAGFTRGVVPGDVGRVLVVSEDGETVEMKRGLTDGFLTRWYVPRSQMFVRHYFANEKELDAGAIAEMIAETRTPTPRTPPADLNSWGALLRACQIIAQGADPRFIQRSKRLFRQLEEAGYTEKMGYVTAADVVDTYPARFWEFLLPQIPKALSYLKYTGGGQLWLARLNAHMLEEEHRE
ncbi:MAG TPA: hypothetical protein VLA56_12765 [Pseudomonadales bacterium]|nr:hypothetical protein [Pseudomonadales bacterium]